MTLTEKMYRARYVMDTAEVVWLKNPTLLNKKLLDVYIEFYKNLVKNQ